MRQFIQKIDSGEIDQYISYSAPKPPLSEFIKVQNAEVSDTTGDAQRTQARYQKNLLKQKARSVKQHLDLYKLYEVTIAYIY